MKRAFPQMLAAVSAGLRSAAANVLVFALPLGLSGELRAQFTYTSNGSAIIITGYTGSDREVVIPDTIEGLPVVGIGDKAFFSKDRITRPTLFGRGWTESS